MNPLFCHTFSTPLGLFSAAVDASGAVHATAFGDLGSLRSRLRNRNESTLAKDRTALAAVEDQVLSFLEGGRRTFDLRLNPHGTPFQLRVWSALLELGYGTTTSYGKLAATLRSSPRAVGGANGANPICLIIPCHRVIGSSGQLTGFAFGEAVKRQLLDLEARTASNPVLVA